ncbi:MAG: T9SS type A sorting domain-containing protein [Bacteroidetes bacterium]|nr:T9SS type A sorting domain-containing protein [Bacteroidota bacterium]
MKKILLLFPFMALAIAGHAQSIANPDFENWQIIPYQDASASYWITSNYLDLPDYRTVTATKVAGNASPNAIHLETHKINSDYAFGFITNTLDDVESGEGGQPYHTLPTTINGYYRYDLPNNDTAILMVILKNNGNIISSNVFKIKGTGSQSTFTSFSFTLAPMTMVPDSVIIVAASSNVFNNNMSLMEDGSWLELDDLQFQGTGAMDPILNGDFETWGSYSFETPDSWSRGDEFSLGIEPTIKRSADKYTGSYALQLESTADHANHDYVETGIVTKNIVLNQNGIDTIKGFYKYTSPGGDTAAVSAQFMDASGNLLAYTYVYPIGPATSYQPFFFVMDPADFPPGADSIRLEFMSSYGVGPFSGQTIDPIPGSTLLIDGLTIAQGPVGIKKIAKENSVYTVYPNPAISALNIKYASDQESDAMITIRDAKGSVVYSKKSKMQTGSNLTIQVGNLTPGVYFYTIKDASGVVNDKFYKQ